MTLNRTVAPPVVPMRPYSFTLHGCTHTDPYAWLKAKNWAKVLQNTNALPKAIANTVAAENTYSDNVTANLAGLRNSLFNELKSYEEEVVRTVPYFNKGYWYYEITHTGRTHPTMYRRKGSMAGAEEVVIDYNAEAEGHKTFLLGSAAISPDYTMLAYLVDTSGNEQYRLVVRNISTGETVDNSLYGLCDIATDGSALCWTPDSKGLLVVHEEGGTSRILHHIVGTSPAEDTALLEETSPAFGMSIEESDDGQYIFLSIGSHDTSEYWLLRNKMPLGSPRLFAPRKTGTSYSVDHRHRHFVVLHNDTIYRTPDHRTGRRNWRVIRRREKGVAVEEMHVFKDFIAFKLYENAQCRLVVRHMRSKVEHTVALPGDVYALDIASQGFWGHVLRVDYSNPAQPMQTFDYAMHTRKRKLVAQALVPSGHNPQNYVVERLWAPSTGGVQVPLTVLRHKDVTLDGKAPALVYAYGGYAAISDVSFNTFWLPLVNRGVIFAIAHVRGGGELGESWHEGGCGPNKPNTFADAIAAGEHLVNLGYAAKGNMVIHGGSAGGMMAAAASQRRPDLWKAAWLDIPFVDVLGTLCDPDQPQGPWEHNELGNPLADKAAYRSISSYCPYTQLQAQAYPHTLITAGLADVRVAYWQPLKYAARLRALNTASTLTLLQMDAASGHAGDGTRYGYHRTYAWVFATLVHLLGLPQRPMKGL